MRTHWWTAIFALALAACTLPVDGPTPAEPVQPAPGQGLLEIHWSRGSRAPLGSTLASTVADAYELLLVGPAGVRSLVLSGTTSQTLSVDPGTWSVIVLAGAKRSSGSSTAYLVGSALAEGVTIAVGQRTPVSLVLRSIDLSLAPTGPVSWKGTVGLAVAGQSRNPRVGMSLAGASTSLRPRFKSTELWGGYREMAAVTGTPEAWSAEVPATVPDGVAAISAQFVGAAVVVLDAASAWVSVAGVTNFVWVWPNAADLAEGHALAAAATLTATAGPPPTGLEVGITWE